MNEILKETNFDENFPQDDSYISDFPAGARKQNKALKDEQIVDAGKLQGLIPSNENGQIPINNGNENINLNAGMLNGKTSSDFAPKSHSHDVATQDSNGYMSNADKRKLDGIASGAEVNQNAFANVKVGSNTIQADAKQDTLELVAGTNISLVGDANNDKVTIGVTGKVASASQADNATNATNATKATNATNADVSKKVNNTATDGSAIDLITGTMAANDYFRIRIGGKGDSGYAEIATSDNGNEPIYIRQYAGANFGFSDTPARTATILDSSGNTSFPGKVTASGGFVGNATSATKATQDSAGQTINTTYVKGVTANNATLTITKGNGSTSTTTVNNVSRAEYSDRVGTNAGYTGSTTGSSLKGGLSQAAIYNNSFPFSYGNLISIKNAGANQIALEWSGTTGAIGGVAVRSARDAALGTWSAWRYLAYTESPAFSGSPTAPTPGTSDNGTRIATTAFVQSLINSLKGSIGGTISAISLNTNGYVKFSNGLIIQWGSYSSGRQGYPTNTNSFNFPITFPSTCYLVMLSPQDSDIYTSTWTTSTVTIKSANNATSGEYLGKENVYINAVRYIAIGK